MKLLKMLLLIGLMVGLTGCYTQLEYSQKMNRVTDKPSQAQNSDQERQGQESDDEYYTEEDEEYIYDSETEEYIPANYQNYNVYKFYNDCYCSPYASYDYFDSWYGSPGISFSVTFGKPYWGSRYSWHHYNSWHRYMAFNYRYHHYRPYWGNRWGHPYYSSYYGYPGHYSFIYNTYYPVTKGSYVDRDEDRSYSPRNIGTNRVAATEDNAVRSRANSSSRIKSRSDSSQDSRIITRTRSASDSNRTKVTGERTRTNAVRTSEGKTRIRSAGVQRTRIDSNKKVANDDRIRQTVRRSQNVSSSTVSRIGVRGNTSSRALDSKSVRSSLQRQRVDIQKKEENNRTSFFGNLGKALKSNAGDRPSSTKLRSTRNNNSRSSGVLKKAKNNRSNNKSVLKKSKSSSSSSKSRVRSSSSSNRGSSSGNSSSKKRSRGGNN